MVKFCIFVKSCVIFVGLMFFKCNKVFRLLMVIYVNILVNFLVFFVVMLFLIMYVWCCCLCRLIDFSIFEIVLVIKNLKNKVEFIFKEMMKMNNV